MQTLTINLQPSYDIYFAENLLRDSTLAHFLSKHQERLAIITDSHLLDTLAASVQVYLQKHNLTAEIFSFTAGEANKTRETKQALEDQLLAKHYSRDTCLIIVGGGVVTDLAGFVAATYCRGISSVYLPTSMLAMVDASIGGKTAVDTPYGKNMIGCFYQPKAVFMSSHFLQSLSYEEYINGFVEVIKHALIADAKLFAELVTQAEKIKARDENLLNEIIYKSCVIKKTIVEQDPFDHNLRNLLNLG